MTRRSRNLVGAGAELSLAAVTVTCALSLPRLFEDFGATWTVVAFALFSHACIAFTSRLPIPQWAAALVTTAVGAIAVSLVFFDDTLWGPLPTTDTISAFVDTLDSAFSGLGDAVAPVPSAVGFEVALACGFWLLGTLAGAQVRTSLHRGLLVVPHVSIFALGSILALGTNYATVSIPFVASLVVFALISRYEQLIDAERDSARPNATSSMTRHHLVVAVGAFIAVSALTLAALPTVREADQFARLDLRRLGNGAEAQSVQSPLVSIQGLLNNEPNTLMFTARTQADHYWRQTALEDFDGVSWSSSSSYRDWTNGEEFSHRSPVGSALDSAISNDVDITLSNLESRWLPLPYVTRSMVAPFDIRYDDDSESVFLNEPASEFADEQFEATYVTQQVDPDDLSPASVGNADDQYRLMPTNTSPQAAALADQITAAATSPYDAARRLQDYFRDGSFAYDTSVDYSQESDALAAFLEERVGFCQQFASTYSAVARLIGLPSRVAVGFTGGDVEGSDDSVRTVRGRDAHAWPEVYFDGFGWLAFEPTPTRANPTAAPYTGVEQSEVPTPSEVVPIPPTTQAPQTEPITTTTSPAAATTTSPTTSVPEREPTVAQQEESRTGRATIQLIVGLVVLMIAGLGALIALRRSKNASASHEPNELVANSWKRSLRLLAVTGYRPTPDETPTEFVRRCAPVLDIEGLSELAAAESKRRWATGGVSAGDSTEAVRALDALEEKLEPDLSFAQRVTLWLSGLRPNR